MSAFPQRLSQKDFLAYYASLKDDDELNGEDLLVGPTEDPPSEDEPDEELDGLIDRRLINDDDEATHKQLDAARRAEEEVELQALAKRFDARAAEYDGDCRYDESFTDRESSWRVEKVQAIARLARVEAEKARRAEEEEEKQKEAAKKKRKRDAMAALYAFYEAEDTREASAGAVLGASAAVPPVSWSSKAVAEASGGSAAKKMKKPFRIAKKAK